MTEVRLKEVIQKGEGIEVEFKRSLFKLNKNAFETICAFLNRKGGHLVLGVENSGGIEGVVDDSVQKIVDNIVTSANNPQKLNPPFYLSPHVVQLEGKKVIYLYVPESSQVHQTNGRIYDRNEDGDFDITGHNDLVTQLYVRKQSTYSENNIYPFLSFSDFHEILFPRIRKLANNERPDHPWMEVNNEELMRSSGLFRRDYQTGKEGYTLAAVLLLGKDEVIRDILPHYKTDAILRREDTDRYDDREDIRTNLIDSYDRLMAFAKKHLPDRFYQEGGQRVSIRDRIFREVIANCLIHREFTNAFPAKFIIEKEKAYTENWNRPHGDGLIDPDRFSPYPKNPVIASFFREIGRVDELGSGVRNTFKYCRVYKKNSEPEFIEKDVFKTIVPLPEITPPANVQVKVIDQGLGEKLGEKLGERLGENELQIVELISKDSKISITDMADKIGISTTAIENNIKKLKKNGFIDRIGPAKGGYWKINI